MVSSALTVPFSDNSDADSSPYWSYTITVEEDSDSLVHITGVTDVNGNTTDNLSSTSLGSWGWDENFEYGPFGSYYAAFNQYGGMISHVRADDLRTFVGNPRGSNDLGSYDSVMWVLPTVYWKTTDTTLTLTNDPTAGGTAYAHTIDGIIYNYLAIGVYEMSIPRSRALSCADIVPITYSTREDLRKTAEHEINVSLYARSSEFSGYSMLWNYYHWALYKYCVFATFGSLNVSEFGCGLSKSLSSEYSPTYFTGRSVTSTELIPGYYSSISNNNISSTRLFLEDSWGSLSEIIDNVVIYNNELYAGQTHNASDDISNLTKIGMVNPKSWKGSMQTSAEVWGINQPGNSRVFYNNSHYYRGSDEIGITLPAVSGNYDISQLDYIDQFDLDFKGHITSRLSFVFDVDPIESKTHTVVYYGVDDGSLSPSEVFVTNGKNTVLPEPVRQNWTFVGWYDYIHDYKVGNAGDNITVFRDRQITARWADETVNLVMHSNHPDSAGDEICHTAEIPINTAPPDIATYTPAYDGYNFLGWYNEAETLTPFDSAAVMTADRDAYAKWAKALVLTSYPTVRLVSENTYSLSVELEDNWTAAWFDTYGNEIGTGASIECTFAEPGIHVGTVKVTDSADSTVYAVAGWSTESAAEGSTGENTEENGMNIPLIIGIAIPAAVIGFFLIRRL